MKNTTDEKIDELARMVAEGLSDIHREMATKADLEELRDEISRMSKTFATKQEVEEIFTRFVGIVRSDYDGLARRVKDLELTR